MPRWEIRHGHVVDELAAMPAESVDCVVTSPPYLGLRDYKIEAQVWPTIDSFRFDVRGNEIWCKHRWDEKRGFCDDCGAWRGVLGLEPTPDLYVRHLVEIFDEVHRVLKPQGTLWLNLGDSFSHGGCGPRDAERWPKQSRNDHRVTHQKRNAGLKPKDLVGIPWMVAFALRAAGWWLRSDIVWAKPNPMPESVRDRPTNAHEYLFLLAKSQRYYYDVDAVREPCRWPGGPNSPQSIKSPHGQGFTRTANSHKGAFHDAPPSYRWRCGDNPLGRNRRSVWTIATTPFPEAHFATFPEKLVEPCIKAGCPEGGVVLDPFAGAGTVGVVAKRWGRRFIGIELNQEYCEMARRRIGDVMPLLARMAGGAGREGG